MGSLHSPLAPAPMRTLLAVLAVLAGYLVMSLLVFGVLTGGWLSGRVGAKARAAAQ